LNHIRVNPESGVPLYYQIRQDLLDRIHRGELKPGDFIPSEQEISSRLAVSRMTARQAVKSLCSLGVAYSLRGKGTFVSGIKFAKNVRKVQSFTEEMKSLGHQPSSKALKIEEAPARPEVASALSLEPAELIFHLRRLRLADSIPMGIEGAYLPHRLYPGLLTSYDPKRSLYEFLWERYGVRITLADETIEAGLSGPEESRLLRIPNKSPVFIFTRVGYARQHQAVEFVKSTYRADRYKIVNRLRRVDLEVSRRSGTH
jgi:GntR family transcriptional regulator